MTISDIHYYIDQELQRMGYFVHDHFQQQEIDVHVNKIIRDYVQVMHTSKKFETISTLFRTFTQYVNENSGIHYMVSFPEDYFLYNSSSAECCLKGSTTRHLIPLTLKDSFEEPFILSNPFAKSSTKKFVGFFSGDGAKVYYCEKTILKGIIINYTCKPKILDITLDPLEKPDLPESTHDQLAQLVAEHLKRIIESSQS